MNDEAGIALDLGRVRAVIVNAVSVERQRRVAEQHGRIRAHLLGVHRSHRRRLSGAPSGSSSHVLAVDDVVLIDDGEPVATGNLVTDGHEHQSAGTARLRGHVGNGRGPLRVIPDRQAPGKPYATSGPHSPRRADGRQETAQRRVTIPTEARSRHHGPEVEPVPQRWQGVSRGEERMHAIQRRLEGLRPLRCDPIPSRLGLADPLQQTSVVRLHCSISRSRGVEDDASCPDGHRSPTARGKSVSRRAMSEAYSANSSRSDRECWPTAGTGPTRTPSPRRRTGGATRSTGPLGLSATTRRSCWCPDNSATVFTDANAIRARRSFETSSSCGTRPKIAAISPSRAGRLATRLVLPAKRASSAMSARSNTLTHRSRHSRSFWIEITTCLPSAVAHAPYGAMLGCRRP